MVEVDAAYILNMQAQINSLQSRVAELEQFQAFHQGPTIGQAGMLFPHPYLSVISASFGNGNVRLDKGGIQVANLIAPGSSLTAITFLNTLVDPDNINSVASKSQIRGQNNSGASIMDFGSYLGSGKDANLETLAATTQSYIQQQVVDGFTAYYSLMYVNHSTGEYYFTLSNGVPLFLQGSNADPAIVNDGEIWYRTDLNAFRFRAGGVTSSLTLP